MKNKTYTIYGGLITEELDLIEVTLRISEKDWEFYRKLFSVKRDSWFETIETTVNGPKSVYKAYIC